MYAGLMLVMYYSYFIYKMLRRRRLPTDFPFNSVRDFLPQSIPGKVRLFFWYKLLLQDVIYRVHTDTEKSWNLKFKLSRPGLESHGVRPKCWKIMESHGK